MTTYLEVRAALPVGALFCVLHGPTAGRRWEASAARKQLRRTAEAAGVRRRFAPHQLRHAHAIELAHEGVPLVVIQRQLGHRNLGVTSIYLQGIDRTAHAGCLRSSGKLGLTSSLREPIVKTGLAVSTVARVSETSDTRRPS
ncbi:MAG: tyrosine-type recombinase/integrase [Solirubrobacterales bacterium]|nr:tyrosine-type recombinase/integrase [Solirubrobacterales bacterium]